MTGEFELAPGVRMFYHDDDCTDPWRESETIVLLHGFGESALAWQAWMPHLVRSFRVVRPDMRGFGRSTAMPEDYPWSIDATVDDYVRLLDRLGVRRFHLVGAKVGGGMALRIASTHPERVRTLTVLGSRIISGRGLDAVRSAARCAEFRHDGIATWARRTMRDRLGSDCAPEMFEGWAKLMSDNALSTLIGFTSRVPEIDVHVDLPLVAAPTLLIMTDSSGGALTEETRARQRLIARSELLVLPGDSNHVAAANPERCAGATCDFIQRNA